MSIVSYNSVVCVSEYTTFLSLPVNATQVHIINRSPLFTHMGEQLTFVRDFYQKLNRN